MRSGAVSSSVPSRSNKNRSRWCGERAFKRQKRNRSNGSRFLKMREIVDADVAGQAGVSSQRVVAKAAQVLQRQPGLPSKALEFRWTDESRVVMGAAREQSEHVLGAEYGRDIRFRTAAQRREEQVRTQEPRAPRMREWWKPDRARARAVRDTSRRRSAPRVPRHTLRHFAVRSRPRVRIRTGAVSRTRALHPRDRCL